MASSKSEVDDEFEDQTEDELESDEEELGEDEAIEDLDHATKMAAEFFAAGSGGPDPYSGRDMLTTHKGMNVSEQEFIAVVDDIMWALDKHSMTDETKKDVLAILYSLKDEIIRV